jgi:hypothetical protein
VSFGGSVVVAGFPPEKKKIDERKAKEGGREGREGRG